MSKDIQRRLAALRTDLDSFSEAEAHALMSSGYLMAGYEAIEALPDWASRAPATVDWPFLDIVPAMRGGEGEPRLAELLDVGKELAFKPWRVSPALRWATWLILIALVAFAGWVVWTKIRPWTFSAGVVVDLVLAFVLVAAGARYLVRVKHFPEWVERFVKGFALAVAGVPLALLHLALFDQVFLSYGRVKRVVGEKPPA